MGIRKTLLFLIPNSCFLTPDSQTLPNTQWFVAEIANWCRVGGWLLLLKRCGCRLSSAVSLNRCRSPKRCRTVRSGRLVPCCSQVMASQTRRSLDVLRRRPRRCVGGGPGLLSTASRVWGGSGPDVADHPRSPTIRSNRSSMTRSIPAP